MGERLLTDHAPLRKSASCALLPLDRETASVTIGSLQTFSARCTTGRSLASVLFCLQPKATPRVSEPVPRFSFM